MNEPRNPSDRSGDAFQAWLETTSLAIKSLDANHMVTIGAEVRVLQMVDMRLAEAAFAGLLRPVHA